MSDKKRYRLKRNYDSKFDLFKQMIGYYLNDNGCISKRDINRAIKVCENKDKNTVKIAKR